MNLKKARAPGKRTAFSASVAAGYARVAGRLAVRQGCVLSEEPILIHLKLKKAREIRKTHCVFSERGSGLCPRRRQTCRKARLRPIRGAYPYSCVYIPKNALRFPHPNHICTTPGNVRRHRRLMDLLTLVSNEIPATLIASYNRHRSTNLRFFDFCRFRTDKIIDIYNFVEYNSTKTMGAIL